ncbi:TPA: helix-turn-helix domain-containing protein [Neisseria meningitidis]|uniref:helix-turn-helix domain-containing protein n=1 Tax=Neisseria meningitidis TaxID=487 RepID=UPI00076686BE|nr:helix-turn-helix domain-containing protein [Neisseria meningitidis]MBW3949895.1 helix-turn-helix domain-containing protein [Neisseria meningitidis]MBW3952465.1 helix-turn-helix domain-containing protein [Neisseria meningitidis]CWO37275.1 putative phage associated protein [Neisseria meningitidis]CWS41981.1 putative phage associated protein [Neisseria meningitidis]
MSARLMGMAFKTGIPRGQRFVLVKLCDCANDEGLCYPSQETLAEDTGFAATAVRQHIKWLKEHNFIKSARRQSGRERKSDIYRINVALLEKCYAEAAKRKAVRQAKMWEEPSDYEPSDYEPSDYDAKNHQILCDEPSDFDASLYEEPSVEPSVEPSELNARAAHAPAEPHPAKPQAAPRGVAEPPGAKKTGRHSAELSLLADYGITGQVAADFLQVRKAKRQPLTETAMRLIAADAEKCGMTALQAVEYAIGNGWASFRADWLQNKTFGGSGNRGGLTHNQTAAVLDARSYGDMPTTDF